MENIDGEKVLKILNHYKSSCYICSHCGKIIFPKVEFTNNYFKFSSEKASCYGGLGNKKIKDNICPECTKQSQLKKGFYNV